MLGRELFRPPSYTLPHHSLRAWENIKGNIKTSVKEILGLHELMQHKPWFEEEYLGFLDQRKQAKMLWLQDPSQSNVYNLNNIRHEASRHFRNKKKECLKAKMEELVTNSTLKNVRDLILRRVTSLELI